MAPFLYLASFHSAPHPYEDLFLFPALLFFFFFFAAYGWSITVIIMFYVAFLEEPVPPRNCDTLQYSYTRYNGAKSCVNQPLIDMKY